MVPFLVEGSYFTGCLVYGKMKELERYWRDYDTHMFIHCVLQLTTSMNSSMMERLLVVLCHLTEVVLPIDII